MSQRTRARQQNEKHSGSLPTDQATSAMVNFEATDRQGFGSGSKMYNIESQERNDSIGDVKEERSQSGNSVMYRRVIYSTHFNIFLYSTCFWIQTGTLPVSTVFLWFFFFLLLLCKKDQCQYSYNLSHSPVLFVSRNSLLLSRWLNS